VTPPVVLAEVDLDSAPEPAPPARRSPLLAAAVVAAVLGLVGAAALRSALTEPPAPARPAVTAWASVVAFTAGPDGGEPVADVVLTVSNRDDGDLTLTDVAVDGPRVAPGTTDPGVRHLPAGGTVDVEARVPLTCDGPQPPGLRDGGLVVRATVTGGHIVVAAPVGVLAVADGVCRTALTQVPEGWSRPLEVESAVFDRDRATLVLDGFPEGSNLVALYAPAILPVTRIVADADDPGRFTVDVAAPSVTCQDGAERIPFGLQARLQTPDGLQTWYADVGPDLAGWLLGLRAVDAQSCREAVQQQ
jgi:hypothetical protein